MATCHQLPACGVWEVGALEDVGGVDAEGLGPVEEFDDVEAAFAQFDSGDGFLEPSEAVGQLGLADVLLTSDLAQGGAQPFVFAAPPVHAAR